MRKLSSSRLLSHSKAYCSWQLWTGATSYSSYLLELSSGVTKQVWNDHTLSHKDSKDPAHSPEKDCAFWSTKPRQLMPPAPNDLLCQGQPESEMMQNFMTAPLPTTFPFSSCGLSLPTMWGRWPGASWWIIVLGYIQEWMMGWVPLSQLQGPLITLRNAYSTQSVGSLELLSWVSATLKGRKISVAFLKRQSEFMARILSINGKMEDADTCIIDTWF